MIPKVNLRVGEMGFMWCEIYVSLKLPFAGDINLMNLPCFDLCFARQHIRFSEF